MDCQPYHHTKMHIAMITEKQTLIKGSAKKARSCLQKVSGS